MDSFSRAGFVPSTRNFNQMLFLEVQSNTVDEATLSRVEALVNELDMRGLVPDRMTLKNVLALKKSYHEEGCSVGVEGRLEGLVGSITARLGD